jgi:alpha/beta superfamily hydrolase
VRQSAISFLNGKLELEGAFGMPDDPDGNVPGVVVCHPHPLRGGNMDNLVVTSVYRELVNRGMAALRFNFRGVGNSQGSHEMGEGEVGDVEAALEIFRSLPGVDGRRVGLAGYSFGSGMVLKGMPKYDKCRAFALISPPPRFFSESTLPGDSRPKLVVCGDQDSTVPLNDLNPFAESMAQPAEFHVVEGADHFWGHLVGQAASTVADFFAANLK